jgi:integrase/recombinase XerD
MYLAFDRWPDEDRSRWQAAFQAGDRFDEAGPGAHLAASTRKVQWESYARFLGFLSRQHPDLLNKLPEDRIDRSVVANYVAWRRSNCGDFALSIDLDHLRGALKLVCPGVDWSWLLTITKRIAASAPRRRPKYNLVTSERLYALGLQLMDAAFDGAEAAGRVKKAHALQYRDGLIIALLALIPLRKRTFTAIRLGKQLVKTGNLWSLDIPATDTKTRHALDYPIADELSERIDVYLDRFRPRIPGADQHTSPWASNQGCPMCPAAIYEAVRRRTRKAFGFPVNLHRFRHAGASFWAIMDPANVRGIKDLLGQSTFSTTEKHYIMSQSRVAARTLAQIVDRATDPDGSKRSARS